MKSLLSGLLIISSLQIANAASTDTVKLPIVITAEPIEARVVEIRMTGPVTNAIADTKKKRKLETLPLIRRGVCSGAFINSNGDILTAKHCVTGFETFEVLTHDQRTYSATVVSTSAVHDLALLHVDRRNTAYFQLASNSIRGQKVFILGSPLGITNTLSTGIIAKIEGDFTLLDCSALPGNSGGPVFDVNGHLVGVLNAGYVVMFGVTHLNQALSLDAVHFFLKKALEKK